MNSKKLTHIVLFISFFSSYMLEATDIISSGRDHDVIEKNHDAVLLIDQALDKLGISRPPHRLEFVPSHQLAHMATLGGVPIEHWWPGSQIIDASDAMGVLEFVTPGCTCRSFYSDNTKVSHQIEILKHVGGHNDMAVNSFYSKARPDIDPIEAAEHLNNFIQEAYWLYDFDEVAQWYQYLLTFSSAQDLARGTFSLPESFKREEIYKKTPKARNLFGIKQDPEAPGLTHPKSPTQHELQFMVYNLPVEVPQWKKDMAALYEKVERVNGFYASTKIMNEGWATFMQELLVPYLPWQDSFNLIEAAELKTGVAYERLSNPYWLGREAWRNLYRKFYKEKQKANSLELDREFVQYAHKLMGTMGDYDFLRLALNNLDWVRKHKLYLYRKASNNEIDKNLPPPKIKNMKIRLEQKVVLSNQAQDVADFIATRLADRSRVYPTIYLEDMAQSGRNIFALRHKIIDNTPLRPKTAIQAMYIRSQVWQRPVSLRTSLFSRWINKNADPELIPIRIEVGPDGSVQVYFDDKIHDEYTNYYKKYLDSFIEELDGSVYQELDQQQKKRFASIMAFGSNNPSHMPSLVHHSPTSASAILRYYDMVNRRLYASIKRALAGKAPLKRTQHGARIRVLPEIPEFELDKSVTIQIANNINYQIEIKTHNRPARSILDIAIQPKLYAGYSELVFAGGLTERNLGGGDAATPSEGDRVWGPADDGGSGSPGDPDDGDSDEEIDAKGKPNPTEIDIPLDLLGEFLKEDIELPKLKPKGGRSELKETERDGVCRKNRGEIQWERVAPAAIAYGAVSYHQKGIDKSLISKKELMREGMRHIQPSDWIVPDQELVPLPEMNAVIVIWMDMTGSMAGKPIEMAKQFMFNLKALLSTKYKNITFRYIGFADSARVYDNEEDFFKSFINGGTNYAVGIKKAREIVAEYNMSQWDRYAFGIGDAEDQNPVESSLELRNLAKEVDYSAFVQTLIDWNSPNMQYMSTVKDLASDPQASFGLGVLKPAVSGPVDALRQILGKKKS